MTLDTDTRNAINTVMSALLPLTGVQSLDLPQTYELRDRVARVCAEVEFYRVQVENHLADLNSKLSPKASTSNIKLPFNQDPITKLAKALSSSKLDLANLLSSLNE